MYAIGILLLQITAYLSIIPMIMYADWYHYLIALFMYFMNGCLGMIMGYHRLLTHRSFQCPVWFERFITLCATIGLTGPAIDWVAIHKAHHRFADTEKDPHSPDHMGIFRVHFLTMFARVDIKYAGRLLRDRFLLFQRKYLNHLFQYQLQQLKNQLQSQESKRQWTRLLKRRWRKRLQRSKAL